MTRAAELLHVSQPTLSKTLNALEEELGKKLFTRHSFSIELTDEGMLLRDRAAITVHDLIGQPLFASEQSWNRYQTFTPLAQKFPDQIRSAFSSN